jgi:type VI secretion system secreted protein VgrG
MMSGAGLQLTHDMVKFDTNGTTEDVFLIGARIDEELGRLPRMVCEFVSRSEAIKIDDLLGSKMSVSIGLGLLEQSSYSTLRHFRGTCIAVENLGHAHGCPTYLAEIRPWLWFLTKMSDNTIYSDMTVPEIVKKVMSDAGFSDITDRLSGTYRSRGYTVQYNESHFDFISRLMEEEGIYYYFDYSGEVEKMVLSDGIGAHDNATGKHEFKFDQPETGEERDEDEIYDLSQTRSVTTGKIKLVDYDYLKPNADLKVTVAIPKGSHSHKNYQKYDMDGHYVSVSEGEAYARLRSEHEAQAAETYKGEGNARTITCGAKVIMSGHQTVSKLNALVKASTCFAKTMIDREPPQIPGFKLRETQIEFPAMDKPVYVKFDMQPDSVPFRPERTTPAPDLSGLHTAVVVGPDGEEIATDEHGRIQVRFHWMTDQQKSCWARVMAPWTGKGYGFYGVPRIGHEVVVQFERNNPDTPIVVGMIYNATNNYPLPAAEVTKIGFKTRSSKSGAAGNFNEFTMDDKKDAEMVTLQSEKDYTEIIKNNATITIGMEKADPGDLTQTIKNTKTETIKEGDFIQTVEKGNRSLKVKTNHTDIVEGTWTTTITGNTAFTVKQGAFAAAISKGAASVKIAKGNMALEVTTGNYATAVKKGDMSTSVNKGNSELLVKTGNHKMTISKGHNTTTVSKGNNQTIVSKGHDNTTVGKGNQNTNVSKGNIKIKAGKGKITLEAKKSIELKVGKSVIKISPVGLQMDGKMIKATGKMVKIEGKLTGISGKLTKIEGSALLVAKGGITKIN